MHLNTHRGVDWKKRLRDYELCFPPSGIYLLSIFAFYFFLLLFYEMCFPSICERYIILHFLLHVLRKRLRDYKICFPWHILCVKASLYILDIQHFGSCCVLVVHTLYLLRFHISMLFARVK